jgi:hypothetical protein
MPELKWKYGYFLVVGVFKQYPSGDRRLADVSGGLI